MHHRGLCEQLEVEFPPEDMKILADAVGVCISTNHNDELPAGKFKELDELLRLFLIHKLSVQSISRYHQYKLTFQLLDSKNTSCEIMIWFRQSGVLRKAQKSMSRSVIPQYFENILHNIFNQFIEEGQGNRLKLGHKFIFRVDQKDKNNLTNTLGNCELGSAGVQLLQPENRKLAKKKTNRRNQSSVSTSATTPGNGESQSIKGWKGEEAVVKLLLMKLKREFSDSEDLGWQRGRYQFTVKGDVVAEVIWEDHQWLSEQKRKNTIGYDIEVVSRGSSTFHEVKTGESDLSPAQQKKASEVGPKHYAWWRVYEAESETPTVKEQIGWRDSLEEHSDETQGSNTSETRSKRNCNPKPAHPKLPSSRNILEDWKIEGRNPLG